VSDGVRWISAVHDDGYFDSPVGARYDEGSEAMFGSAVVDPVVDV